MIDKAEKYSISNLFYHNGVDYFYTIPPYQREYSWGEEACENLYNDIKENDNGYFLGSMICILEGGNRNNLEVIDGQQRITTISILMNSLYTEINTRDAKDSDLLNQRINGQNVETYMSLKKQIIELSSKKLKLKPSLQRKNEEFYNFICKSSGFGDQYTQPPERFGSFLMGKAYNFFKLKIENLNNEELFNFAEKLNKALVVRIDVDSPSSAFTLFESINNRGTPLTALDLVKNTLIRKNNEIHSIPAAETNESWQTIINNIPNFGDQTRFLRHYYHAFKHDSLIFVPPYQKATPANLIKIYDKLVNKNVKFILNDLTKKSLIYSELVSPDNIDNESTNYFLQGQLLNLQRLGVSASYALLLYLFCKNEFTQRKEIIELIENWFIRRHITNTPPSNRLDDIFINLIKQISELESKTDKEIIKIIRKSLFNNQLCVPDNEFENKLINNQLYTDNAAVTKYLLAKLESNKRGITRENNGMNEFWKPNDNGGKQIWSIEHILPQTPKKGEWNNFTEIDRDELTHKLGNLTLSGYNSKLSNGTFIKKCEDQNYGFYSGNVKINEYLCGKSTWCPKNVDERGKILADEIINLLKIENLE